MSGGLEQFHIWFAVCLASFTAYSYIRVVESWGKVSPQKRIMEPSTAFAGLLGYINMIANDLMYGDFGLGAMIGLIAACLGIILIVMAVFGGTGTIWVCFFTRANSLTHILSSTPCRATLGSDRSTR